MEATAKYLEGWKFEVEAGTHKLICDQPRDNGGEDAGMAPPEFLLVSLASCAGYYAAQYLKTRSLPVHDLAVRVTADKELHPARLASFHIEVSAPSLGERHETGLLRAVKACLIHNTLIGSPAVDVSLTTQSSPGAPLQSGAVTGIGPGYGNSAGAGSVEWRT